MHRLNRRDYAANEPYKVIIIDCRALFTGEALSSNNSANGQGRVIGRATEGI